MSHICGHTDEKQFLCDISSAAMNKQSEYVHNDERQLVSQACIVYLKQENSAANKVDFLSINPFVCKLCNKSFKAEEIKHHDCTQAGTKGILYNKCNEKQCLNKINLGWCETSSLNQKAFRKKSSLNYNIQSHIPKEQTNVCTICSATFQNEKELSMHFEIHIQEKSFSCKVCLEDFENERDLYIHKVIHRHLIPLGTDTCDQAVEEAKTLTKLYHNKNIKRVVCYVCGKIFPSVQDLTKHRHISHSMKKLSKSPVECAHVCSFCHKIFCSKSSLRSHIRIHSYEKPYSCDICSAAFKDKINLSRHSLVHSGKRPFVCDLCPASFKSQHDLSNHFLIHTNRKPFSCTVCSRSFQEKTHLKRHLRTHTGEKPYVCDICSEAFHYLDRLKMHKITFHSETPSIVCDICQKPFLYKSTLMCHLRRSHTNEKKHLGK